MEIGVWKGKRVLLGLTFGLRGSWLYSNQSITALFMYALREHRTARLEGYNLLLEKP